MGNETRLEIERFLKEFTLISGNSIVCGVLKSSAKKSKIRANTGDLKIKPNLKDSEYILLYSYVIDTFSKVYGSNIVDSVIHKIRGTSAKGAIKLIEGRQGEYNEFAMLYDRPIEGMRM
jgi:hypothetical protein